MFSPNRYIRITSALPGLLIVAFFVIMLPVIPDILVPMYREADSFLSLAKALFCFLTFICCYILCVWSYLKCVFTHPGPVTQDYLLNYDELYGSYRMRFCETCDQKKPPRCHHCSICRMCIVNMDHHCPWVCNCVGYLNKKFFILFLFYAWIGSFVVIVLSFQTFFPYLLMKRSHRYRILASPLTFVAFVLSLSFFVALLFFGGFHVWLVFNDQTTIETSFNCQRFTLHGRSAKKIQYYRNWCNVMDTNPFLWLIPVHDKSFHFAWDFMEDSDDSDSEDDSLIVSEEMHRLREMMPLLARTIPISFVC